MTIGTSIWGLPGCAGDPLRGGAWCSAWTVGSAGRGRRVGSVLVSCRRPVGLDDRPRIGRVEGSHGPGLLLVHRIGRPILDVRNRRVLGMRRQPIVDETLDDPAPPEGGSNVVPAPLALEILDQLRISRVAL